MIIHLDDFALSLNLIPFLYEDAPVGLTRNRAVGAIHELPLPE
ncbi:MAG: hypothetical protein V7K97_30335 [Nostoc sp.]